MVYFWRNSRAGAGTESENTEECSFPACFPLALSASIFIDPRPFCSEMVSPTVSWELLYWLSVKKIILPSDGNSSSDFLFPVSRSELVNRNCDMSAGGHLWVISGFRRLLATVCEPCPTPLLLTSERPQVDAICIRRAYQQSQCKEKVPEHRAVESTKRLSVFIKELSGKRWHCLMWLPKFLWWQKSRGSPWRQEIGSGTEDNKQERMCPRNKGARDNWRCWAPASLQHRCR